VKKIIKGHNVKRGKKQWPKEKLKKRRKGTYKKPEQNCP